MRAAMRKREAIQPRKYVNVEADAFPFAAGSNVQSISEKAQFPSGSESVASMQRYNTHTWEI